MKITIIIITWIFTLFPNLIAKESYNWWLTRRRMEIIQKYLKKNIQSVGRKYREALRTISQVKMRSARFRRRTKKGCEITSQQKADFAALRSWLSSCGVRLPTALTPSFQLRIAHRLKHWIADFLSFKTTYSMHKLDFRKCSKSG